MGKGRHEARCNNHEGAEGQSCTCNDLYTLAHVSEFELVHLTFQPCFASLDRQIQSSLYGLLKHQSSIHIHSYHLYHPIIPSSISTTTTTLRSIHMQAISKTENPTSICRSCRLPQQVRLKTQRGQSDEVNANQASRTGLKIQITFKTDCSTS